MKRWPLWLAGIIVVIIGGVLVYTSYFASTANAPHTAAGAITPVATTPIPANTTLRTFQITPAQSTASYSVHENLIIRNNPNAVAVGRTHSVQGNFRISTSPSPLVAAMSVTVDLRTLQTDESMRDRYVRRNALETDTYPTATFVSVSAQGLPATYTDGQTLHFQLIGNLTMHGKTNKETFDVQGKVVGNTVTGTATSTIYMTDFGIQPPNLANIAIAQNKVLITIDFTAKEG